MSLTVVGFAGFRVAGFGAGFAPFGVVVAGVVGFGVAGFAAFGLAFAFALAGFDAIGLGPLVFVVDLLFGDFVFDMAPTSSDLRVGSERRVETAGRASVDASFLLVAVGVAVPTATWPFHRLDGSPLPPRRARSRLRLREPRWQLEPTSASSLGDAWYAAFMDRARPDGDRPRSEAGVESTSEALVAKLESVKARALAVTMGVDATTDADALLAESNPLWGEVAGDAKAMLPVVTEMARALGEALDQAPAEVKAALGAHREAAAAARFDWIEPPRVLVAFVFLEALERVRDHCAMKANARR